MDREKVIKRAERIMCSTVDRDMIDSFCEDVIAVLKEQEELLHKKQKDIDRLCVEISELKHQKHDKRIPYSPDSNVQWT